MSASLGKIWVWCPLLEATVHRAAQKISKKAALSLEAVSIGNQSVASFLLLLFQALFSTDKIVVGAADDNDGDDEWASIEFHRHSITTFVEA